MEVSLYPGSQTSGRLRGGLFYTNVPLVLTLKTMHFAHTVHLITALHFIRA